MTIFRAFACLFVALSIALLPPRAEAAGPESGYVWMQSRANPVQYVNNEGAGFAAGTIQPGWWSAQMRFEFAGWSTATAAITAGSYEYRLPTYRIVSRWKDAALGAPFGAARWLVEPGDYGFYQLRKEGPDALYLYNNNGKLEIGRQPSGTSAQWGLIGFSAIADTNAVAGTSYDADRFTHTGTPADQPWLWDSAKGNVITIFNPKDGGVVLRYQLFASFGRSDGCSAGLPEYKMVFVRACLGHDRGYATPWDKAGFPKFSGGLSAGRDLTDTIFYWDMLATGRSPAIAMNARSFYDAVRNFGGGAYSQRLVSRLTPTYGILDRGGAIVVLNHANGWDVKLNIKWTTANGVAKSHDEFITAGQAAAIPLSVGSRDISIEAKTIFNKVVFTRSYPAAGMYTFTTSGWLGSERGEDGLK